MYKYIGITKLVFYTVYLRSEIFEYLGNDKSSIV